MPSAASGANSNESPDNAPDTAAFHEQDAQRRLGNFEGAGEHSVVQPGGKQGPNR